MVIYLNQRAIATCTPNANNALKMMINNFNIAEWPSWVD
jgi:hypothetical protein